MFKMSITRVWGNSSMFLLCLTMKIAVKALVCSQFQIKVGCMSSDLSWDWESCENLHWSSLELCSLQRSWGWHSWNLGLESKEQLWPSHGTAPLRKREMETILCPVCAPLLQPAPLNHTSLWNLGIVLNNQKSRDSKASAKNKITGRKKVS